MQWKRLQSWASRHNRHFEGKRSARLIYDHTTATLASSEWVCVITWQDYIFSRSINQLKLIFLRLCCFLLLHSFTQLCLEKKDKLNRKSMSGEQWTADVVGLKTPTEAQKWQWTAAINSVVVEKKERQSNTAINRIIICNEMISLEKSGGGGCSNQSAIERDWSVVQKTFPKLKKFVVEMVMWWHRRPLLLLLLLFTIGKRPVGIHRTKIEVENGSTINDTLWVHWVKVTLS